MEIVRCLDYNAIFFNYYLLVVRVGNGYRCTIARVYPDCYFDILTWYTVCLLEGLTYDVTVTIRNGNTCGDCCTAGN